MRCINLCRVLCITPKESHHSNGLDDSLDCQAIRSIDTILIKVSYATIPYELAGVISWNFNKGGSRYNVIKRVWLNCNHAHIFKDRDKIIQSSYDII